MNYYNEFDPKAAAWLRELMAHGHIPQGEIDTRSITDVQPSDLNDYVQCHFFAGIGGWPLALQLAGWPEDRPVWTGSCPCQPFSAAGKQLGTADERHLWPRFFELIKQRRPATIFGEQVCSLEVIAGKQGKGRGISEAVPVSQSSERFGPARQNARPQKKPAIRSGSALDGFAESYRRGLLRGQWLAVQPSWWENMGQPITRSDRPKEGLLAQQREGGCSCSEQRHRGLGRREDAGDSEGDHGTAHRRLKLALGKARQEFDDAVGGAWSAGVRIDLESAGYSFGACDVSAAGSGAPHIRQRLYWVADANGRQPGHGGVQPCGQYGQQSEDRSISGLEHPQSHGRQQRGTESGGRRVAGGCGVERLEHANRTTQERLGHVSVPLEPEQETGRSGHANAWSNSVALQCSDGKARRTEPGIFPLAHGVPGRVGLLRGYGNAIVPQVAAEFIQAYLD